MECPLCSSTDLREPKRSLAQHVYTDAASVMGRAKVSQYSHTINFWSSMYVVISDRLFGKQMVQSSFYAVLFVFLMNHITWNVQSACRMTVGLGQDRIHASSVFAMPMIGSARTQWRTPTLNSEWLIKLTDPRESENVNRVNIRLDSL